MHKQNVSWFVTLSLGSYIVKKKKIQMPTVYRNRNTYLRKHHEGTGADTIWTPAN